ncbi:MAG: Ribosomal protein L11 methyltransferase [Flavobacteriia bacterium]|nr:MAG: Ribosomal protein L11 methyltransferase [Flavobacteriia bacterium]
MSWLAFEIDLVQDGDVEIASAFLQNLGFSYFEEQSSTLLAYWEDPDTAPGSEQIRSVLSGLKVGEIRTEPLEDRNWNEEWERNYPAVEIGGYCRIRAPFHDPSERFSFELEVRPAMAFGTGHHATTSLVIRLMEEMEISGERVLDMGCGTGVLGILAEKKGAREVVLADNFDWACASTEENMARNSCSHCRVVHGGPEALDASEKAFDLILANINRNVLLEHIPIYHEMTAERGRWILSGFYAHDAEPIRRQAAKYGWQAGRSVEQDGWVAQEFQRA